MARGGGQKDVPLLHLLRQGTGSSAVQSLARQADSPPALPGRLVGVGKVTARFDDKGRLLTYCAVCGKENAGWGFGVDLLRGRLGTWYCTEHRPHA